MNVDLLLRHNGLQEEEQMYYILSQVSGMMVAGIDSYHDSAKKGRSVGAFVASMNKQCTRYYSRCMFQHTGQEMTDGLKTCLTGLLSICITHRFVLARTEMNPLSKK